MIHRLREQAPDLTTTMDNGDAGDVQAALAAIDTTLAVLASLTDRKNARTYLRNIVED